MFTAFAWFRELPAGVPGAFRIFANLLSAAKSLCKDGRASKPPPAEFVEGDSLPPFFGDLEPRLRCSAYLSGFADLCVSISFTAFILPATNEAARLGGHVRHGCIFIVSYGLYRGRGSTTVNKYMLAGKTMPWYAMGLSIMATQASAITFISTTGQSLCRRHALRAVLFRSADRDGDSVARPPSRSFIAPMSTRPTNIWSSASIRRPRSLVSGIFLIQRGLAAGCRLYAPAVVLSVILGWPDRLTTVLMGMPRHSLHGDGRHQSGHLGGRAADDVDLLARWCLRSSSRSICCRTIVSFARRGFARGSGRDG